MSHYIIVLFLVFASGAHQESVHKESPEGGLIARASFNLYKALADDSPKIKKSILTSPLSIYMLVSLYSVGADHPLIDQIISALGGPDFATIFKAYGKLSRRFYNRGKIGEVAIANRVYIAEGLEPTTTFQKACASYLVRMVPIDFGQRTMAADTMNRWANTQTRGKIFNVINKNMLSDTTLIILLNAVYFKGTWLKKFDYAKTEPLPFKIDSTKSEVRPIMKMQKDFLHMELPHLDAKVIDLPYQDEAYHMVVILPNKVGGLSKLIDDLDDQRSWYSTLLFDGHMGEVDLWLPSFEIVNDIDFNSTFHKLGLSGLFSNVATGIVRDANVIVSKAIQKTYIKVDERGTTAAAVSVMGLLGKAWRPAPPFVFHATHSFMFAILHKDIVLFTGSYSG